jgi:hypothetical protein
MTSSLTTTNVSVVALRPLAAAQPLLPRCPGSKSVEWSRTDIELVVPQRLRRATRLATLAGDSTGIRAPARACAAFASSAPREGPITNTTLTRTGERKQHQLTSQGAAVAAGRWHRQNSAGALAGPNSAFAASILIALLIACVSLAGLVLGREGLYGSDVNLADGIITSTAGIVIPGFRAHDLFNLAVALPVLLASVWFARRGSLVGLLLWPGGLFYVLYTYVQYLIGAPFGPLFLGYVLLVVVSAYTMIGVATSINHAAVRERLSVAIPARTIGGILVALALVTIGQDGGGAMATALEGGSQAEPLARHVWTVDLTISVPATLLGGVLLWRRAALGYVVAAGLLFAFGLTPIAFAAILALQPWLTGSAIDGGTIVGLLVFATVAYVPLGFFVRGARADMQPATRAPEIGATSA